MKKYIWITFFLLTALSVAGIFWVYLWHVVSGMAFYDMNYEIVTKLSEEEKKRLLEAIHGNNYVSGFPFWFLFPAWFFFCLHLIIKLKKKV